MNYQISEMMDMVILMALLDSIDSLLRAVFGPELEGSLGRPLTEWDWQVYWQEKTDRDRYLAWNYPLIQWKQQMIDQQIIHDIVWGEVKQHTLLEVKARKER